jgi:hypothetical protein
MQDERDKPSLAATDLSGGSVARNWKRRRTADSVRIDVPDIALEVVLTSGGLDKLAERSTLLPDLDFDVLTRFVRLSNQHEAVSRLP